MEQTKIPSPIPGVFNILTYGADPSGTTSSTDAIQAAIDAAAAYNGGKGGLVVIPPGVFLCSDLKMRPSVSMEGCAAWGYKRFGNCILKLDPEVQHPNCLLDLTDAFSCSISNLEILGGGEEGEHLTHGVYIHHDKLGGEGGQKEEDIPTLENCKISDFTGDAVHYHNVWCFQIRFCQVRHGRHGLYLRGVDGFIIECLFSSNRRWGIYADPDGGHNAAVIVSGCRVEWNRQGGFYLSSARNWQISNNSFDRNFGPAIHCLSSGNPRMKHNNAISITGNNFNRNGVNSDGERNAHLILDGIFNSLVVGNTFVAGAQDNLQGQPYPMYGIVTKELKSVVITNNVLQNSCTKQVLLDYGGHYKPADSQDTCSGMIWQNNPSGPATPGCYHPGGYFMPCKND